MVLYHKQNNDRSLSSKWLWKTMPYNRHVETGIIKTKIEQHGLEWFTTFNNND